MKIQYCPSCGAKLAENARFCGGCGQKIEQSKESEASKTKQCPNCDYSTTKEEAFCPECGTALIIGTKAERSKKEPATRQTAKKKRPAAKKKTGFLRALGKLVLWLVAFLIVAMIALYFIGDSKDNEDYNREETLETIAEQRESLPTVNLKAVAKTKIQEPFELINKTITTDGAEISEGDLYMSIPPDAVNNDINLEIRKVLGNIPLGSSSDPKTLEAIEIGTAYDIGPDGISFEKPVTFSLSYDPTLLPNEIGVSNLILAYFDGQKWVHINAYHDRMKNSFTTTAEEFPGTLIHIIGIPVLIVGGAYIIVKGTHKKVYQLIWDPIRKDWIHTMIKPKNKEVQDYAKRLRINDDGDLIPMDDMEKFDEKLQKLLKKKREIPFGFIDKNNKKQFIELTKRYDKDAEFVKPPEDYIDKVDEQGKFGDCIDVTNAYVSMLRAKGVQAKGVAGYTVDGGPHAWVELVIGTEVYAIDEYARLTKREDYISCCVKYPKPGDTYRKMWDENGTKPYVSDWYKPTLGIAKPADKIKAQDGKTYSFSAKTLGLPNTALFSWNFNQLGYSIPSQKKTFNYKFQSTGTFALTCKASWNGKELTKTINITVYGKEGIIKTDEDVQLKPTVFITTRLLVGPPGATFDMEAVATPKGSYRFVWQVDGLAEAFRQTGEKSGIAPVISKKGKYNAVVSLYSADNTFLASDKVTISVEEEELNTEGIEGIVDIDEGIKESVQKAWVLSETKIDNRAERVARKNKSYTNVYNFEQNHSRNSNYSKQTFIGKTDTYYNPPKKQGESLAAQFNWTDPPKYINPGDKITIQLNGKVVSENLSFFGFGFHMAAGVCIYEKGADDGNWCESLRNAEGKSSQACNKKNRSFSENVSVDKIPKGDKDEILIINVSGGIEGGRTEYIYEWK